jgi:rhodanese-related sulfurtransferase
MCWKRVVCEVAGLTVAAVAFGATANHFRIEARKVSWSATAQPRVDATAAALPVPRDPGALFVDLPDGMVSSMHQAGTLFIDARRSEAYREGHISNARSIAVWEHDADARIESLKAEGIPFDREIVVYCSGPDCHDSERLAEKLAFAGYFRLSIYRAGFPGWQARGGAVTRGEKP